MTTPAATRSAPPVAPSRRTLVLVGIDGAGKTTVAHALSRRLGPAVPTLILTNYSGRRAMRGWLDSTGLTVSPRVMNAAESAVRSINAIVNHGRARRFHGLVIMDRHLCCQEALGAARGLRKGWFVAAVAKVLPLPDTVIFLDVTPEEAHHRIMLRGTDTERLEDLRAYRNGYRHLSDFSGFHQVAADGPLPGVLDRVQEILAATTPPLDARLRAKAASA